jgi:chemotaxis-related protein WspD
VNPPELKSDTPAANGLPAPASPVSLAVPGVDFDCWNRIGVYGDGSCKELPAAVHCRNCPVYSAAGARLLDREPPRDYKRYWTEYYSRERKRPAPGRMSAVIFRLGAEWLALSTRAFQEVTERRKVHSLPHRRNGIVLGVTNVRGELLVCISLARLLGLEHTSRFAASVEPCKRLVVAEWQGSLVTFPVNEVHGVHRFQAQDLQEVPATVARANPALTRAMLTWNNLKVGCLDEESLFSTINRSLA